jgi:hypothetical protein
MPRKKRFPLECQSPANQEPIGEQSAPIQKRTPRPREQKIINSLISGEAKSLSNALVRAGFNPTSSTLRNRFEPGGDLRAELDKNMETAGLTVPFALSKLRAKMDARKHLTVAGEALETEDNDAQLRATDMTIKLLDRAGKLPAEQEAIQGSGQITVNVLVIGES